MEPPLPLVVDTIHSVVRRLVLVACATQIVVALVFVICLVAHLDEFAAAGDPTVTDAVSLAAHSHYLVLSVGATEFMVSRRGWRLRLASFFLVLIIYHFGWYHYLHFINIMGHFSFFSVLGKAAIVVGPVVVFVPMFGNILVCFLAAFLGN